MRYSKIFVVALSAMFMLASCVTEESVNLGNNTSGEESYIAGEIFVKFSPEVATMIEESGAVR